jgi:heme/copper-type cytochrome/quinol oxidase subunit 4
VFLALVALTAAELLVATAGGERAARITALAGLLMAKVALVLTFFMRARASRRAARLALVALVAAAGFAVVLMLEAASRARVG